MSAPAYNKGVFLNCPFDSSYKPILDAIVFTLRHTGLRPRCALEVDDGSENRLDKIFRIIAQCRYGIHDISRTELDPVHSLPRFNMPLELGIFLGAKRFGGPAQNQKACLILGRELYQHQKFASDLGGQDVHAHHNDPRSAAAAVRAWVRTVSGRTDVSSIDQIWHRYELFQQELSKAGPALIPVEEMTFVEFVTAVADWLHQNP